MIDAQIYAYETVMPLKRTDEKSREQIVVRERERKQKPLKLVEAKRLVEFLGRMRDEKSEDDAKVLLSSDENLAIGSND